MKTKLIAVASLAVAAGLGSALASPLQQVSYASTSGSEISFGGGDFTFSPAGPENFTTGTQIGGAGTAGGLAGDIAGTFAIGAISTSGSTESASVTGTGTFSINDGSGHNLTGTLTWVSISQTGTGSTLNDLGVANLSGLTYSGANLDLLALVGAHGTAIDTLDFTFTPAQALTALKAASSSSPLVTSFSGSLSPSVPDGGTTVALLGGAFSCLAWLNARRKK